ncbi:MAG TPA: universal stress protein [Burkholderiales bacterium]|jgi:Universal stress protein UspA and related nucleotide-binding proteins
MNILLAVDGSENSIRATKSLIEQLSLFKEAPQLDVVTVHLPLPNVGTTHMITSEIRDKYYKEECDEALAPTIALLDAAKVPHKTHRLIGQVAETVVKAAKDLGSNVIYMGTHGRTGMTRVVMGSVATKVLHLSPVPVQLVR